jgi:hypothetical protein
MVTTALGYTPVTNARQLTINGTTYDLSADRSWTISGTIGGLTSGYIPKATSASTLGNSLIYNDATGVGIGTISPSYTFHTVSANATIGAFRNSGAANGQLLVGNTAGDLALRILASGDALIFSDTSKYLAFGTNGGSERMRLTSAGNLGLGVTPSAWRSGDVVIDLGATTSIVNAQGQNTRIYTNAYVASGGINTYETTNFATYYDQGSGAHRWFTAPSGTAGTAISFTQAMTLDASGRLGIGTTSPLAILSSANTGALTLNSNDGNHTGFGLYIQAPSTTNTISSAIGFGVGARKLAAIAMQSYADDDQVGLNFYVQPSATGSAAFLTEAMRITSAGNVGIGTTSPGGNLEIYAGASGTTAISNGSNLIIQNSAAVGMSLLSPDANASRIYFGTASNNRNAFIYSDYNSGSQTLIFGVGSSTTAATERMRITSTGNVGIGTTSPSSKLQIQGTGTGAWLTINRTDTGSNIVDFTQSGTRLGYLGYIGNDLVINNATASSIQFNSAGTERMRITSGGNVLIGTTTDSGFKLDVNGTGRFSQTGATPLTVVRTTANSNVGIRYQNNTTSWYAGLAGDDAFGISFNDANLASGQFKIAPTGAATFSSSVTASGDLTLNGGSTFAYQPTIRLYSAGGSTSTDIRNYAILSNYTSFGDFGIVQSNAKDGNPVTAGTTRLYINLAGNVGIGTTLPPYLLSVGTTSGGTIAITTNSTYGSVASPLYTDLRFIGYNNADRAMIRSWDAAANTITGQLTFWTNSSANTFGERMRITGDGNVGIGTTSPSLESGGTGLNIVNSSYTQLRVESSSSSAGIEFKPATGTRYEIQSNTSSQWFVYDRTNAAYRLLITSGGNVLIGSTTDSGEKLVVSGSGRFTNQLRAYNLLSDNQIKGSAYVELSPDQSTYNAWNIRLGAQAADACYYITGGGVNILTTEGYNNPYTVKLYSNGVQTLTMTNGASTFSSSVTATRYYITPNGSNTVYNIVNSDSTYAGSYIMQAGGGSAGFGGGLITYGHSHATKPGWVTAGISVGSGGKFSVNNQGLGGGTDLFVVESSTGNVGIGTTNPVYKFVVSKGGAEGMEFDAGNIIAGRNYIINYNRSTSTYTDFQIDANNILFATPGSERMRITSGGNVLIGTTTDSGYKLQVNGNIQATGFYESSDKRLKDILFNKDSENFGAISFNWKDKRDSKLHWGYVAQEVEKFLPDAIIKGNDGFLSIDYNQAHTFKIAMIEDEVTILKRRVKELETQLNLG